MWFPEGASRLWLYNLHYFDDLNAKNSTLRLKWHIDLVDKWLDDHSVCDKGIAFDSYPTSLRIVNWIKWCLKNPNLVNKKILSSLIYQSQWLSRRIEWHLMGNHVLANAKALIFSGCFLSGMAADRWFKKGINLLEQQLKEQILDDGGHFELSPMYQAIIVWDILDLINLARAYPNRIDKNMHDTLVEYSIRMIVWLKEMTHLNGEYVRFNDCAFGVANPLLEILDYAKRLHLTPMKALLENRAINPGLPEYKLLSESGYARVSFHNAEIFIDVSNVMAGYIPGHTHADTFSFELSIFGKLIVVNGGTSTYDSSNLRLNERGTSLHSTVEIDGKNSSEIWGSFRLGRRARTYGYEYSELSNGIKISCSHDGYSHLTGSPIHSRTWITGQRSLKIEDVVSDKRKCAISRYILHPEISVVERGDNIFALVNESSVLAFIRVIHGSSFIESSSYSPEFGDPVETSCLAIKLVDGKSSVEVTWN